MITTTEPTVAGFDLAIEVRGRLFNLKSVKEPGNFTHINIHDEEGKFVDEFASGFPLIPENGFAVNENTAEFEDKAVRVFEYIDENLIF